MLSVIQIGMNTSDLAGSLRLMSEAFGFENAGAQALWGSPIRIQSLQESDRAIIWWLLGRQPGVQLEFFHHTSPAQRPLRADWQPCDLGWVRFGIAVSDFDKALAALAANAVECIAPPVSRGGLRRVSFRDPFVGCIVEVLEDGPDAVWSVPGEDSQPVIVYATSSVSDIASARAYYGETLGMAIADLDKLHVPDDEACWGLQGAERTGFIAHNGGVMLEIVEYTAPRGQPKPADYRTSDQGIVNVGLMAQSCEEARDTYGRLAAIGLEPTYLADSGGVVSGYITQDEREIELVAAPQEVLDILGFKRGHPFLAKMM